MSFILGGPPGERLLTLTTRSAVPPATIRSPTFVVASHLVPETQCQDWPHKPMFSDI